MFRAINTFVTVDALVGDSPLSSLSANAQSSVSEAVEALQALGYRPADADKMIKRAQQQDEAVTSASLLIKNALRASVKP